MKAATGDPGSCGMHVSTRNSLMQNEKLTPELALATEVTLPPVLEATAFATAAVFPPVSCRTLEGNQRPDLKMHISNRSCTCTPKLKMS